MFLQLKVYSDESKTNVTAVNLSIVTPLTLKDWINTMGLMLENSMHHFTQQIPISHKILRQRVILKVHKVGMIHSSS